MGTPWDAQFDRDRVTEVRRLCDATDAASTIGAWQALVTAIAPFIEQWAESSWVLRRWRLSTEDDARAVLLAVLERLNRDGYANLRRFHERQSPADTDLVGEVAIVERAARLAGGSDDTDEGEPSGTTEPSATGQADDDASTPFRAWILTLLRFCVSDHIRGRMGWSNVTRGDQPRTKRDLGTDAARLDEAPTPAARPPITDLLTVKAFVEEAERFASGFPPPMKSALDLWLEGHVFSEIAASIGLDDAAAARKLVRAAQARLRQRFRGRWDALRGAA